MINITYSPSFEVVVEFDEGAYTYQSFVGDYTPIDVIIALVKTDMENHNFKQADIIDANTGEILAQLLADDIDEDWTSDFEDD